MLYAEFCNIIPRFSDYICVVNCSAGTLPLQLDLANLEISSGNHKLRITATDITGLNHTAVIAFSGKQFRRSNWY